MKLGAEAPVHQIPFTRRRFLAGTAGATALVVLGDQLLREPWAYADGPTVGLPRTGTAPEQVHLTFGADPTRQMVVSWASPGTQPMPRPSLTVTPAAAAHGGRPVTAAVEHRPYTDGLNLETVHSYHARLDHLQPGASYTYVVADGAGNTVGGSFTTAPAGRARFRFTSVGDLATPTAAHNVSGTTWNESSDNAFFTPRAVEAQQPLFHLLNGDLCYANLNTNNAPEVWRDFGRNNQVSAANRPWMPCLGNHEIEWGVTGPDGRGSGHWNGAHGYASYASRYTLPDNGVRGFEGSFYAFQVGTVLFVSLDADDVAYQDGGSYYAPKPAADGSFAPLTATNPAVSIPPGTSLYNREYTGRLAAGPDGSVVPDRHAPNRQTQWLERTLASARRDPHVDMIVVQMHQCALSSSSAGNGSDLGIRQAWLPLFDRYEVDLVVNGHDHDYERSFPVRGHLPGSLGTVVAPNPGQPTGAVDTRTPRVASGTKTRPGYDGAYDTATGTVFLTLGGGGTDGPTATYGAGTAKVITQRNQIYVSGGTWVKNGADSTEPAAWSARRDTADAYGFAVFDVDPGRGRGDTTITMTVLHAPTASGGAAPYQGTTSFSVFERVLFGRGLRG